MSTKGREGEVIAALTAGVSFEPGVTADDFWYVEKLGFLATRAGRERGALELVGYQARTRDGLYDRRSAYPWLAAPSRTGRLMPWTERMKQLQGPEAPLKLGNYPDAIRAPYGTDTDDSVVVELWGVMVHRKIHQLRQLTAPGVTAPIQLSNKELDRPFITLDDLRKLWRPLAGIALITDSPMRVQGVVDEETGGSAFIAMPLSMPVAPLRAEVDLEVYRQQPTEEIPVRLLGTVAE